MPYVRGSVRLGPKGIRVTRGHYRSPRGSGAGGILLFAGLFVLALVFWILKTIFDFIVAFIMPISIIAGVALAIFGFIRLQKSRLEKETSALVSRANEAISSMNTDEAIWNQLQAQIDTLLPKSGGLQNALYDVYRALIIRVVRDGKVTDDERSVLRFAENTFALSPSDSAELKREGFLSYLEIAVLDNKLTIQEEANLNHLIDELGVNMGYLTEQTALIAELLDCRKISEGQLSEASTSVPLKDDEKCYMDISATEIVRRKKGGEFFYDQGEVGTVTITNKQFVFRAGSAMVLPLRNILEVRVDNEERRLEVVKSGRLTPYYFRLDQPRKAALLLETLAPSSR